MGKFIDITGQRFNMLIALRPTDKRDGHNVIWECQCDCGKIALISGKRLRNGQAKCCGCLYKKKPTIKKGYYYSKIQGQRFGKLIAIKPTDERRDRKIIWECLCDCGKTCYIRSSCLISGHTKSCGCLTPENNKKRVQDLIGQKFNKLTVIEKVENEKNETRWKCQCECGGQTIVSRTNLISGITTSCGCIRSKGEETIANFCKRHNIQIIREKTFKNCRDRHSLSFDCFLPEYNLLIEYQGQQHFKPVDFFGGEAHFERQVIHDLIKEDFCEREGIRLVQIAYYENIEARLNEILQL